MAETTLLLQPGVCIKPKVTVDEVKNIVKNYYGLNSVSITELNGYDDKNYKIIADCFSSDNKNIGAICPDGYVLKIMNSLDSKKTNIIEAQNELMLFLAKNNISCSKPVKTKAGQYYTVEELESGRHVVRLLEFIPGFILHQVPVSKKLLYETGYLAAKMDVVLKNFYHSAYESHQTIWKLDSVPKLRQFLFAVKDDEKRRLIEEIIDHFEEKVLKCNSDLEKGIIHGDLNEQNIVVDKINNEWKIVSVLDFGDTQYSYYLYELAIAMTYMMIHGKNLELGGYVLSGYSSVRPVPEKELKLLKVCIGARMCQSLVMGAYTSLQEPNNSYLLVTAASGWILLQELWKESEESLLKKWKTTADEYDFKII